MSSSTVFVHPERDLEGVVHGDDFTFLGAEEDLKWIQGKLMSWYEFKVRGLLGPDAGDDKSITILNRTVTWTEEGIEIKADPKHAQRICDYFELDDNSKSLCFPGSKEEEKEAADVREQEDSDQDEDAELLDPALATDFRGLAATANYLGADRADTQHASKELCRLMSSPTKRAMRKVKGLRSALPWRPLRENMVDHASDDCAQQWRS